MKSQVLLYFSKKQKHQFVVVFALWLAFWLCLWIVGHVGLFGVHLEFSNARGGMTGIYANTNSGRLYVGTIVRPSWAVVPHGVNAGVDWIYGHRTAYKWPIDKDMMSGSTIYLGFGFQAFTVLSQDVKGLFIPMYFINAFFATMLVVALLRQRKATILQPSMN